MGERKLTKAQREALIFVAGKDDGVVLWQYLASGHSLLTLMSMNKRDLLSWHSATSMATCVLPSEYEHIRDTTSYVTVTDAGRSALEASNVS